MASFNPNQINGSGGDAGSSGTVVFRPTTSPTGTVVIRGDSVEAVAKEALQSDSASNTKKAKKKFVARGLPEKWQGLSIKVKQPKPRGKIPAELTEEKIYNTPLYKTKTHNSASGKHQFVEARISPWDGEIYPVREPVLKPGQENLRTLPGLSPAVLPIKIESEQASEEGGSGTVVVRVSPTEVRENIPLLASVLHANTPRLDGAESQRVPSVEPPRSNPVPQPKTAERVNQRILPVHPSVDLPMRRESGQASGESGSGTVVVRVSPTKDRENIPLLASVLPANTPRFDGAEPQSVPSIAPRRGNPVPQPKTAERVKQVPATAEVWKRVLSKVVRIARSVFTSIQAAFVRLSEVGRSLFKEKRHGSTNIIFHPII